MERSIKPYILKDLSRKIILISGPRQCGKTTLALSLTPNPGYFNFDHPEHRSIMKEMSWDREKKIVIFDEIHKMSGWKSWLKGIFDVDGIPPGYVVTGSARMDMMRKAGDSLAGRYFSYRLHPFDIKELTRTLTPDEAYRRLEAYGGFPEPFLSNNPVFYGKWMKSHTDSILRQDLIDLEQVRDIRSMETLIELLRKRTGSPVSASSLAIDLQRDPKTVRNWLRILEDLYVIFAVRPYHKNLARAILKEPKYYFFDSGRVLGDEGQKLENITACALKKEADFIEDTAGIKPELCYIRNKDGKEIDFAVFIRDKVWLVETKAGDGTMSPNFSFFSGLFKNVRKIQLVKNLDREKTFPDGSEVRKASGWLANLDLSI